MILTIKIPVLLQRSVRILNMFEGNTQFSMKRYAGF